MRIPARYAPLLFSALLSAIMVSIVSGFVLLTTHGLTAGLPARWLKSCLTTWPVAFAAVFVVAPQVRRIVARITAVAAEAASAPPSSGSPRDQSR